MTIAPGTLITMQHRLTVNLGTINLGIVGDASHIAKGGYHIGAKSLRAAGMSDDYSLQFEIDKKVTHDYACAFDVGGTTEQLNTIGTRIVHALKNRDPRVYNRVRAVNASFDGQVIDRRYDTERPNYPADDNQQPSSDRNHLHVEIYRSLILDDDVINDLYDVLAGNGDLIMDAEVEKRFNSMEEQLNKILYLLTHSVIPREVEDLKLDRAQSAHDATEQG